MYTRPLAPRSPLLHVTGMVVQFHAKFTQCQDTFKLEEITFVYIAPQAVTYPDGVFEEDTPTAFLQTLPHGAGPRIAVLLGYENFSTVRVRYFLLLRQTQNDSTLGFPESSIYERIGVIRVERNLYEISGYEFCKDNWFLQAQWRDIVIC